MNNMTNDDVCLCAGAHSVKLNNIHTDTGFPKRARHAGLQPSRGVDFSGSASRPDVPSPGIAVCSRMLEEKLGAALKAIAELEDMLQPVLDNTLPEDPSDAPQPYIDCSLAAEFGNHVVNSEHLLQAIDSLVARVRL